MPELKEKIKSSTKKCSKCHKYFDTNNVNFFLNLAISKKIKEQKNIKAVNILKQTLKNNSDFDWCYCYSDEKLSAKRDAENFLFEFEKSYKNFNTSDISLIGLDFFSNKNYIYFKNGQSFNKQEFFNFLKITKNKLEYEDNFSFDFLTYEKMRDDKFIKFYKSYFNFPNFLVIDEIELLNGKENNNIDNIVLRNILAIIKERNSNDKKTFVTLSKTLVELKSLFSRNFWDSEENVYIELIDILSNENNFSLMNMTINKKDDILSVKTQKIRQVNKQTKNIKINKEDIKKQDMEYPDFDD